MNGKLETADSFDVIVIGSGAVGSAIARELSRYRLKIGVLERELEPGLGNSSRNSGVLHAGFTYRTGSLKAICSVEGNQEFDFVADELGVPFRRTGKLVVGFTDTDRANLEKFKALGDANGVKGLEMVDKNRLRELDASAGGEFGMFSPASGILDPFLYTIALAENAAVNGVEFLFGREVVTIDREWDSVTAKRLWRIQTASGERYRTRWVVNASGPGSAEISAMLGIPGYTLRAFKGEYIVLDKKAGAFLSMPVYPAPDAKGGFATHATLTVDGNVLIGPDSYVTSSMEDYSTTRLHQEGLVADGKKMFSQVRTEYFIRSFAGVRTKLVDPETGSILDFVCEARDEAPNTVNLVGIESPGLTSALPLARRAAALIAERESLAANENFNPRRVWAPRFSELGAEEKSALIARDPDYGEIVCRCEEVTKAEILAAIRSPLCVRTVAGVKNRTRATMGRCQGGYCEMRIAGLLREELGLRESEILLGARGSRMFAGPVREPSR